MAKRYRKLKAIRREALLSRIPKIRKPIPPPTQPHSSKKGGRGYDSRLKKALFRREVLMHL